MRSAVPTGRGGASGVVWLRARGIGEGNARLVTGMAPDAELVTVPEAGHLPWLDAPRVTADRAREFLGQSPGAPIERLGCSGAQQ